ncbi:MAG: hypothetical protein ACLQPD_01600 [Desulfomonilaceae bacterium]
MMLFRKLVLAFWLLICFSGFANAQDAELRATVKSLQGTAQVLTGSDSTQEELKTGSLIRLWDSVNVGEKSKLLLSWERGLLASMGELSTVSLASEPRDGREVPSIQIDSGIFRFATQQMQTAPFSVNTPLVSIYPATDQPVDFSVEVYTPETTLVTVLSGQVIVTKLNGEQTVVPSCHNLLIEEGKDTPDLLAVPPEDINRLVEQTTIPGTIVAATNECNVAATAETVPLQPPQVAIASDYYIGDWDATDEYPAFEVSILPPVYPGADYIAVMPGIGEFVFDIPYQVDPAIINVYIQRFFCRRGIFFYRDHLAGLRLRQRELAGLMYLARMTGDMNLLRLSQRRLDQVNIRADWAAKHINKLDRQQLNFSTKLPRDADFSNIISKSINSPRNLAIDRKFEDRLSSDLNVQTRLANMAGEEIGNLRTRIAKEPNLGKRLAMRQELSRIQGDVASGQALVPKNQQQVDTIVRELAKADNPDRRAQLEDKLAGQLKRYDTAGSGDLATRESLAALRRDSNKIPNAQARELFQNRVASLQQSIEARKQAESNAEQTRNNIQDLSKQAATERNPEKRNELIGRLNDLSKSLSTIGPGTLQFLEQQKLGKLPALRSEPRAITGIPEIQKPLEQQPLERARQQQQLERQKQTEQPLQQRQLDRQKEVEKQQEEFREQQVRQQNLRQQQLLEHQKQLQQQTGPQRLQQQHLEGQKQPDIRQQELQKQQVRQQELRQQQLLERQRDAEKRQSDLKQRQIRDQEQQRQLERQKQQQELQRQQASREQTLRQQQILEQQRNQQIKQQQLQQEQIRQQQFREQQVRQQQLQQQHIQQQQLQQRRPPQVSPPASIKRPEDEKKTR